ncbi:MAG: hypothetical protein EBQ85_04375 [Proteobacteria bacterium]|nr:hypothetical protein [Pseudomonadota bacterium]
MLWSGPNKVLTEVNVLKLSGFIVVLLVLGSVCVQAQTEDKHSLLQIAEGDKLVLKKDLHLPANTERLYYGLEIDSGFKKAGCALVIEPSQKSRKIPQGSELTFSGISEKKQNKNAFNYIDYVYTAGIMNSQAVRAVECYGNTFESSFQDLYVAGMKNRFKELFDFVPVEPEIIH